jgi:DmsE family decaheme c-type cytochrome
MTGRRWRLFAGIASAAAVFCAGIVLGLPFSSRAQQPAKPAAAAAAPADSNYVGAETCKGCHEEAFNKFAKTRMGRLFLLQARSPQEANACETCHGPGKAHVDAGGGKGKGGLITFAKYDKTPVEKRNAVCMSCHTKGARLFWQGSAHESRDVACTNCHKVMEDISPKFQLAKENMIETCGQCHLQKKAQTMSRYTHMPLREGKMTCSSCHNPHGTVTPSLLKEPSVNETCFNCHTEKRGPFLWTHPPVQESCFNCHEPHGSNHENMLKVAKERVCQRCHQQGHPSSPRGRASGDLKIGLGRSCTNCHALVHGSNHPAGSGFER